MNTSFPPPPPPPPGPPRPAPPPLESLPGMPSTPAHALPPEPPLGGRQQLDPRQRGRVMLGLSVAVTLLLYWLPYGYVVVYPLLLLSTLAHEMGHGLGAELVGGDFDKFLMWSDGSGVATYSATDSRLGHALIAAGGLVGPAVAAAILFWLARHTHHARRVFAGIGLVLLILMAFYVRSLFGFAFVAGLTMLAFVFSRFASAEMAQLLLVFVAVQLALAVFSRSDYLFTKVADTSGGLMPSDVAQISEVLFLPYWFWGAGCGLFSVLVLWYGFRSFWR